LLLTFLSIILILFALHLQICIMLLNLIAPAIILGASITVSAQKNGCPGGSTGGLELMGYAQTGIFGCGSATAPPGLSLTGILQMVGPVLGMTGDTSGGGSGPMKASYAAIPEFPRHTLYQPNASFIQSGMKMPVIIWGNGACAGWGGWFSKFLAEISSHGFVIVANGDPNISGLLTMTKGTDMIDAIDWVYKNAGSGQYAHIDKSRLAVAGQSCGGVQSYSASLDPRVTLTGIFNSGLINAGNTNLFEQLHAPIGFFLGGPSDIAYENVGAHMYSFLWEYEQLTSDQGERDYKNLPAKIPTVKVNLPLGHMGSYGDAYGGKFGKAAVAFFKWQMKGDQEAGKSFLDPATSSLTKDGWNIVSKNWKTS
jgi:hypothetical protein